MNTWLSAKAEELAQAAKAKAEELQEGAKLLSENIGNLNKAGNDNLKDLEFEEDKFGFRMDGTLVVHVEPDGQAHRLGVVVGDRLVKVAGYEVPVYEIGDTEGEQRAGNTAKTMMTDMPPPVRLTFAPPPSLDSLVGNQEAEVSYELDAVDGEEEEDEHFSEARANEVENDEAEVETTPSLSELPRERPPPQVPAPAQIRSAQNDQTRDRDKSALKEARQARAILLGNLEAEKRQSAMHEKRATELAEELEIYKAQKAELLMAASDFEVNNDKARGNWEAKEQELEKQVRDLQNAAVTAAREASQAASKAAAQISAADELTNELKQQAVDHTATIEELREKLKAAEERVVATDTRLTQLSNVLGGFQAAHDAELEIVKEEQERMQRRVAQAEEVAERASVAEREIAIQLEQIRFDLEEARRSENKQRAVAEAAIGDAEAARVEANAARSAQIEAERRQLEAEKKINYSAVNLEPSIAKDDDVSQAEDTEDTLERLDSFGSDGTRFASAPLKQSRSTEASALYARIDLLQARCSALQEKLISQRTAANAAAPGIPISSGQGQRIPVWLPHVMNIFGPTAGQLAMLLYGGVDRVLRGATQRLLSRDMWLWLFWIHLVVLYTISASCYSQHAHIEPSTPSESINKFLKSTGGVSAVSGETPLTAAPPR